EGNAIAGWNGGEELVPAIGESGHIIAGDPGDSLLVPRVWVGERRAEPADIGLRRVETDDGIRHAVGRSVENVSGELAGECALIAGVVPFRGRRRLLKLDAHHLAHRVVGRAHVARYVNV